MLPEIATEPPRAPFRGKSPRLAAAKPSNQASGESLLFAASTDLPTRIRTLDEMIRLELNLWVTE